MRLPYRRMPKSPIPRGSAFHGSFYRDGRTTPTATRLEGMIAALEYLPDKHRQLKADIGRAIHDGVSFLLRAQRRAGDNAGAVTRALLTLPQSHPDEDDDFNRRATEVRIDYVQHALSAFIGYRRLAGNLTITT
ncbi:MAG: hypothetical protein MAG453_01069 [Calditrichaeota bacterium]|nr:hypothetical protein [Calditrichota bacterium]